MVFWAGFTFWRSFKMKPLSEQEDWIHKDHYLQQSMDMADNFKGGAVDRAIKVHLMFGLKGIDTSDTD